MVNLHSPRTYQTAYILTAAASVGYSDIVKHWRLLMFAELRREAEMVSESEKKSKPRWLVTCSCDWGRECVSAWVARSVSKLHHPQLAPMDVAHVTRVEGPEDSAAGQQLTLT